MNSFATWTPRTGAIIHVRFDKPLAAKTGRYRIDAIGQDRFRATCLRTGNSDCVYHVASLARMVAMGEATPIDPDDIARDRLALELALRGPLRSIRQQADVDGLGLFDAVRSPRML